LTDVNKSKDGSDSNIKKQKIYRKQQNKQRIYNQ